MKPADKYYTLVASLPYLPRIGQVRERIPLNHAQMLKRFKMLSEDDHRTIDLAWKFIAWEEQDPKLLDADIVASYQNLTKQSLHPALCDVMEFRMGLRTVLSGIRRRHQGQVDPPKDVNWGVPPWNRHMQRNWSDPDFKLAGVFPWISSTRVDIEAGHSLRVEERVMNLVWDSLDQLCHNKSFSFEHVLAFLFKWDILDRWLDQDVSKAELTIVRLTDSLIEDFRTKSGEQLTA